MKDLYKVTGITKQAVHQHRRNDAKKASSAYKLFEKADKIRADHPGVGCRKIAEQIRGAGWGRDKVEYLLLDNGYRVV